ncbi:MAG: gliding motility protein GldN [Bacteroidota bacterium]
MKLALKWLSLCLLCCLFTPSFAQNVTGIMTEASDPDANRPLDDIVEKRLTVEKRVLPYEDIREADVMWEKRVWRVIDIREKLNLPFAYPERPFFVILMEAAVNGDITVYSAEDDKFTAPLTPEEVASQGASSDTITTFDPDTYEEIIKVVNNEINPEDVKRFRLKEVWFFDEESSTMKVRILGIAPIIESRDENTGQLKYEQPMFWVYYPHVRELLAREPAFTLGNDASPTTWEDIMEMRYFSSYIYKQSNVRNERIQDYISGGVDRLLEAEKIKQEIFNFEQDLWSY